MNEQRRSESGWELAALVSSDPTGDHNRMIRDHIKPACEKLRIPHATWLTFRRTWATWADGKKFTPKMRGELMGTSAEINQQVYTKVLPETLRYGVDGVGKELFSRDEFG